MPKYEIISLDDQGQEYCAGHREISEEVYAGMSAKKRARLRLITEQPDPPVNPLTESLGPVIKTKFADGVTWHREAVIVPEETRQSRVRAEAQRRIDLLDASRRERVQMEMGRLNTIKSLTGTLTGAQTTRLQKLLDWTTYWLAVHKHGEDLAADPNLPVAFPAEPAGGAP